MSKRKTTFGKLQRERDKKAKAALKIERREAHGEEPADEEPAVVEVADPTEVMAALEALQKQFAAGGLELEEFEAKRDDLARRLGLS
jgi:hypothetical protein